MRIQCDGSSSRFGTETSFLADESVLIASDKTDVVAALGNVKIGSIASSSTRIGATGISKFVNGKL